MLHIRSVAQKQFTAFWAGQSLALLGGNVAGFALPTVAAVMLGASAKQLATIVTLQTLAFPLLGMVVAAFVERHRKRLAMAYADLGRCVMLGSVPVLFFLHRLTVPEVTTIAAATAALGVIRDVAAQAYVPQLLRRPALLARGNAKLELSSNAAQSVGPAIGGILMHALAAPLALLANAISRLGSAVMLLFVKDEAERYRCVAKTARPIYRDVTEGLRFVLSKPKLARVALCSATLNMATAISQVVSLIFFYRVLHFTPFVLGLLFGVANVGFIGVIGAAKLQKRLGMTGALAAGVTLAFAARALLPLALLGFPVAVAMVSLILGSAAAPLFNITQLTYRQRVTPLAMQSRMHATMRTINSMAIPVGALAGGSLASSFGTTGTLVIAPGSR